LGQAHEFIALAVLETMHVYQGDRLRWGEGQHVVRHMHRFAVRAPYAEVCDSLRTMFATPPLRGNTLVIDQTAVGRPVLTVFKRAELNARITAATPAAHVSTFAGTGRVVGVQDGVDQHRPGAAASAAAQDCAESSRRGYHHGSAAG
jgi:hypothetical protein